MKQHGITWDNLEGMLRPVWKELQDRGGSFFDGPFEEAEDFTEVLDSTNPMEMEAHAALDEWLASKAMPSVSPAANRYLELKFSCAIGLVGRMSQIGSEGPSPEMALESVLTWLLYDVHADTTQVALDTLRSDLAGAQA